MRHGISQYCRPQVASSQATGKSHVVHKDEFKYEIFLFTGHVLFVKGSAIPALLACR